MLNRNSHSRVRGFTLIELLIVVAIIGVLAAILIPNLMDSLQKAKQRRTVNDVRAVGAAWFSWVTDQLSASAAGSSSQTFDLSQLPVTIDAEALAEMLRRTEMNYIATVPSKDGWGGSYEYVWAGDASLTPTFGLRSFGRDRAEGPTTNPYPLGSFRTTAYDEDIVWVDGNFIRFPSGARSD
jgi:general secretion pathway protein G